MNDKIKQLKDTIAPLREQLIHHPVYAAITGIEQLHTFMERHIYAVWDFMSILKALQQNLTCIQVPWFPAGSANTRFLINEIVTGEESDVDETGERMSHYEMYLRAMQQCGADTLNFEKFIASLQAGNDIAIAMTIAGAADSISEFVNYTFATINTGKSHLQAAVFTFGREDLIPDLFHAIVKDLYHKFPGQLSKFNYYLERHIEVDGGHHGHLALQMIEELCGRDDEKWQQATQAAATALQKRITLWDGILAEISAAAIEN